MTISILIADDQAVVRSGFRAILEDEPDFEVVGDAADGHAAVALARSRRANVVLMDIRMPGLDGLEATRRLAGPGVSDPVEVLVVTTFDLDDYVFGALRAGAAGFLLKDASPETLAQAIRAVARGQPAVGYPWADGHRAHVRGRRRLAGHAGAAVRRQRAALARR